MANKEGRKCDKTISKIDVRGQVAVFFFVFFLFFLFFSFYLFIFLFKGAKPRKRKTFAIPGRRKEKDTDSM